MSAAFPWLFLGLLLVLSGFFSASETALFSLTAEDREAAQPRVRRLLAAPRELLLSILLSNLVVNLLFFSSASRVLSEVAGQGALVTFATPLLSILLVGEILPKTLALRMPGPLSDLASVPLTFVVAVLAPVRLVVGGVIDVAHKALGEASQPERGITTEALAEVLERSAHEGVLEPGEAGLLAEIVELESLRVREIMTPRVDMLAIDLAGTDAERATTIREATGRRLGWLPVIRESADRVEGFVKLRDLLKDTERPLEQIVMPVKFVPEVASVLSALSSLRDDRAGEAIVVDEWGGTAGIVSLEDIFEELVGELRVEGEALEKLVVPLGEGRFRVSGGISIREWNEEFGAEVVPTEFETVAGFVIALLGRIPRAGDRVVVGGLVMEVHEVRGRRILTVDMYVEEGSVS